MAFVSLNSIHHFRPPYATDRSSKRRSAACKRGASTLSNVQNSPTASAPKATLSVECVDLTDSLPIKTVGAPFRRPALDSGGTEALQAQGPLSTGPSPSNSDEACDTLLPSIEELFGEVEDSQELQHPAATLYHSTSPSPVPGSEASSPALQEDTSVSISGAPPPSPLPPTHTLLSPTSYHQTVGSSGGALKEMEPQHSGEGEGDGDKRDGDRADGDQEHKEKRDSDEQNKQAGQQVGEPTSAIGTRDSSKRTADTAGLDQGGDGRQSSERAKGRTESAGQPSKKVEQPTPPPSRPRPVFRNPKQIGRRHRKDSTSPSSSDEVGSNQGNPVVLEGASSVVDKGEGGALIKATSGEPEAGAALLPSFQPREEPAAPGRVDTPTEPPDQPPPADVARPQQRSGRVVLEDYHGADPVPEPPRAATPPPSQHGEAATPALALGEWEVKKIVDKRRAGNGYDYKVRWKDTWLPRSELGNAKRLPQEFKARSRHAHD